MSRPRLTPFSYVVLALVGRGGAGPHDIVRMMREGSMFWTTSESHFYAEPKRLAKLGFLTARTEPGKTRARTHYELTDEGRDALSSWIAEPTGPPRIQHEGIIRLLAADFSDDETVLASLSAMRAELEAGLAEIDAMEERAKGIPHRARYLRLVDDYGRRSLQAQLDWLDEVERELGSG